MNTQLKQQLSSLLDEMQTDNALDNLLQALYQEQDARNLYSRYTLIGATMRGETVNVAALHISEQIRNRLFDTKPITPYADFLFMRWFSYTSTWTLATSATMLAILIGLHTIIYQTTTPSPTLLSQHRHFWPGIITLDHNQRLSPYTTTIIPSYPNNHLEIVSWQQYDNNNRLHNYSTAPIPYNNFVNFYR